MKILLVPSEFPFRWLYLGAIVIIELVEWGDALVGLSYWASRKPITAFIAGLYCMRFE